LTDRSIDQMLLFTQEMVPIVEKIVSNQKLNKTQYKEKLAIV